MSVYSDEDILIHSIREYLEYENKDELLSLLSIVKVELKRNSDNDTFDYIDYLNHDLLLKVPISKIKELSTQIELIRPYINDIFDNLGDGDININQIKVGLLTSIEQQEVDKVVLLDNHANFYRHLITVVSKSPIDDIEKSYIIETCNCLLNGNNLAAATMLGCAVERVVILLSESCRLYLENGNGSEQELKGFIDKVVNKKNANDRLNGLINFINPRKEIFNSNGLENAELHLSKFHFIRQLRNDAGHPTGIKISEEELFNHLSYYFDIFNKIHIVIGALKRI